MSNIPSTTDTDPWDRPLDDGRKAVPARHKGDALSTAVPDDWDEATSSGEEDNQTIWDNANKQVPMPQLVMTSPRTGSISPSVVPPASAFQSPIRILKRSTTSTQKDADATDGSGSPASPSISAGTLAERSARYNAARERIFAADTTGASTGTDSTGEGVSGGAVSAIIRNPKGPEPAQGSNGQGREGSQGFGTRTGKRGSSGQPK